MYLYCTMVVVQLRLHYDGTMMIIVQYYDCTTICYNNISPKIMTMINMDIGCYILVITPGVSCVLVVVPRASPLWLAPLMHLN